MILLMTLAQQFRHPKATVAAFWAAALLVAVTSCGVLAAVGWVLLAPPEAVAQAPAKQQSNTVAQAAPVRPILR